MGLGGLRMLPVSAARSLLLPSGTVQHAHPSFGGSAHVVGACTLSE